MNLNYTIRCCVKYNINMCADYSTTYINFVTFSCVKIKEIVNKKYIMSV